MENDKAGNILGIYSENDLPDDVSSSFEQWLSDETDYERKSEAMKNLWDKIPAGVPVDGLAAAGSVLRKAKSIDNGSFRTSPFHRVLTTVSIAAALVMGIVTSILFVERGKVSGTVCMVSSREAKSDFVLPDGTSVWLNRGSRLYYKSSLRGRERKVRLEGEGFFDVYKDPSRPFVVSSDKMEVRVRGTQFTMSTGLGDTPSAIYLREGSVEASVEGLGSILLSPDQALVFDDATGRWTKSAVKASNHTSWIEDKLVFYNTPLYDIIENLEHWYSVNITVDDEEAARRIRLSMTVRMESLDDILLAIKSMTRIVFRYDNSNDNIHISIINHK